MAFLLSVATLGLLPPGSRSVLAAPTSTVSRYEETVNTSTLFNQGSAAHDMSGIVVLDFGQPYYQNGTYGTWNWSNQFFSIAQITAAAESWLQGWYVSTNNYSNYMRLAVGTSNDFGYTGNAHGKAWAAMVNNINAWLATPPSFLGSEIAWGGIDAETEWSDPTTTMAWANGYAVNLSCPNGACNYYVDYGDAGGCPAYYTGTDSPCNGSWLQGHVQYMAWGVRPAYPLPEVYFNPPPGSRVNANQWQAIALDSYYFWGGAMYPFGSMTSYAASGNSSSYNQPSQGWQELQDAMNSNTHTVETLGWATDVTWAN